MAICLGKDVHSVLCVCLVNFYEFFVRVLFSLLVLRVECGI